MTEASKIAPAEWMVETTQSQLERLREILAACKESKDTRPPGLEFKVLSIRPGPEVRRSTDRVGDGDR
jgi:hypothetical protein